jgi:hypothetical protein
MTDKAISRFASAHDLASRPPKRASRRRVEDMTIRKLAPKTQASYIRAVRNFTVFLGRSPDGVAAEGLQRYQLHLRSSGSRPPA